jgi:hypothetical protein
MPVHRELLLAGIDRRELDLPAHGPRRVTPGAEHGLERAIDVPEDGGPLGAGDLDVVAGRNERLDLVAERRGLDTRHIQHLEGQGRVDGPDEVHSRLEPLERPTAPREHRPLLRGQGQPGELALRDERQLLRAKLRQETLGVDPAHLDHPPRRDHDPMTTRDEVTGRQLVDEDQGSLVEVDVDSHDD